MAFDLNSIKNKLVNSDKIIDVSAKIQSIIDDEEFEDKLQKLLEYEIEQGNNKSLLCIRVSKTDRAHIDITFTSNNCMILDYTIAENVEQDNIKNLSKACIIILDKLQSLRLKSDYRPHPDMGNYLSLDNTIEHRTYDNNFVIYLDF